MRRLTALLLLAILTGCNFLQKWSAWRYSSDGLETVPHWNLPSLDPALSRFRVGEVYVHAFLRAHDETTQRGSSPYKLHVVCYAPARTASSVTFHAVEVFSLLDSTSYFIVPIEVDQRGQKVRSLSFPYAENFVPLSSSSASWASLDTDSNLGLRPEKNEEVRIRILVEITGASGNEKGWITYQFKPRLEKGRVGYVGPGA